MDGTGLGMSICAEIVANYRESMNIESEEGKYSCVTTLLLDEVPAKKVIAFNQIMLVSN